VLWDLLKTPLFLVMTIAVFNQSASGEVPRNKSELYKQYVSMVITTWAKKKSLAKSPKVDRETKEKTLASYAYSKFRVGPSEFALNASVERFRGFWPADEVREELLLSGLLIQTLNGPEFVHLSFEEFFYAYYLESVRPIGLVEFTEAHSQDRSYREIFGYLVGLLANESELGAVLDTMEAKSIALLNYCLESKRAERSTHPGPELAIQYLSRLRESYVNIIAGSFSNIIDCIHPWRHVANSETFRNFSVQIKGSLNFQIPGVTFALHLVDGNTTYSELNQIVATGSPLTILTSADGVQSTHSPNAWSIGDFEHFINLESYGIGLDSARTMACLRAKSAVEEVVSERALYFREPLYLLAERIDKAVRELERIFPMAQSGVPKELLELSPAMSTEELARLFQKYIRLDVNVFFPRSRFDDLIFPLTYLCLAKFIELKESHQNYLLPKEDIDPELFVNDGSVFVNQLWSDEQLTLWVGQYYDYYQRSYRELVEACFPDNKGQFPFYAMGPVRYLVDIRRSRLDHEDSLSESWEPVQTMQDAGSVVRIVEGDEPRRPFDDEEFESLRNRLAALGRPVERIWGTSGRRVSSMLSEPLILQREVYRRLEKDLEVILGRL
ncbi:MAG: hypothetical protein JWM80_5623, partial [Cyanobacteria bacterium RYN_339]|nr:hypothetical protein [Cyanobacteria bacterium RYN_339]